MTWQAAVAQSVADLGPALRALAGDLIAIPSVGGTDAEGAAQRFAAQWLVEHGFDVEVSDVGIDPTASGFPGMEVPRDALVKVVGRRPGTGNGPDLLLLGHTDVVPGTGAAFRPRWETDRLIGRGASDMKSGLAAMCVAAAAWARSGHRLCGDLVIAPVSAEEDGGAGTFALLADPASLHLSSLHLAPGSAAVIPEPTAGRIVRANAGCLTFRIRLAGRAAHGALRWRGVNPIDSLPVVLRALRDLEARRCRDAGALFDDWPLAYPISIGTISGGEWASTVPADVALTGRYGVRLGESLDDARREFSEALAAACSAHPWLVEHPPEVSWWGAQFDSAATGADEPIVAALAAAGAPASTAAAPYGSDLRLLVALGGIPTVQFGPGTPDAAHTDDEWVHWPDVVASARTLALTAGYFCGVAD